MKKLSVNYLEKKPLRISGVNWHEGETGEVVLEVENKGIANRIAQKLLKKPKISYIHLDEIGSFVWPLLDGEQTLISLGEQVKEHFGDKAEPLYERLAQYIKILENYKFIEFKE